MNYKNIVFDIVGVLFDYRLFLGQKFSPIEAGIDIFNTIARQRHFRIFACTNMSSAKFAVLKLEHPDIIKHFTGIVTSQEAGVMKPDKEIFRYLCCLYSVDPQETIYLDDMEENVLAAGQMGMQSIVVKDFNHVQNKLRQLGIM